MEREHEIALWDDFWQHEGRIFLETNGEDWTSLVWKVSFDYWQDIFERLALGKKMLECGAGSAKMSLHMGQRGYECTMLENSKGALEAGRKNFQRAGLSGTFVLEDVERISFPDNTFDIVYSGGLLHHFEDIQPAVKEMVRVIKPGGVFGATVITKKFSCQTIGDLEKFFVLFFFDIARGKIKETFSKSRGEFPFYVNSIPLSEYRKVLEEAGLKDVVATGTSPFPSLALPDFLHKVYGKFMKALMPFWKWFDRSNSKFAEIWGASFSMYGIKK